MKRLFVFLALVASGVLVIVLLADDTETGAQHVRLAIEPEERSDASMVVVSEQGEATEFTFEEVDFDVFADVEVEPGRFEERVSHRVHMRSGGPDGAGGFLAERLTIDFLDLGTGLVEGTLEAGEGVFELDSAVGDDTAVQLGGTFSDRFTLRGGVEGSFPLKDRGGLAHLSAHTLHVDGDDVSSPGQVSWWSDGMSITGIGMSWEGELGRLDYDRDAHIVVDDAEALRGLDLFAPGGLTWYLPPESDDLVRDGWGELRGPVTGATPDGSRVAGDLVSVDGPEGRVVLEGGSRYERLEDDATSTLTAATIRVESDGQGRVALVEAHGDALVLHAPLAMMPSSLMAESLFLEGDVARSPDEATFEQDGVVASGTGMTYDTGSGQLEYVEDARVELDETDDRLGVRLHAPAGMSWLLPPDTADPIEAAVGEMRGHVQGTLSDGTRFSADVLLFDGPRDRFTLEGAARVQMPGRDADEIEAHRITVESDDLDRVAVVSATGQVVLLTHSVDVLPARLVGERLDWDHGVVTAPDVVTWTREDGMSVVGTGMVWDDDREHLSFDRDARVTVVDERGAPTLELQSEGALTWEFPADAMAATRAGTGRMSRAVNGVASDGSTLVTDQLHYDGRAGTITLTGNSDVTVKGEDDDLRIASDIIRLEGAMADGSADPEAPGRRVLTAPGDVRWWLGDLAGEGVEMTWDEAEATLTFAGESVVRGHGDDGAENLQARGVGMSWEDGAGILRYRGPATIRSGPRARPELMLSCSGPLVWRVPLDEVEDPWLHGSGELVGDVHGVLDDGSRLDGDRLVHDGLALETELIGNASVNRRGQGAIDRLAAHRIWTRRDALGELERLYAEGDVDGAAGPYRFESDKLDYLEAEGLMTLEGNCRLRTAGTWMTAGRIHVWPELEEFQILQSRITVESRP